MTLKDIAKQLTTAVQTVPNLVQILRDGLEQATAGSTVEVTQVVSSGTKIASVKVDNETTDLYAPSAEIIYKSTEHKIGKWSDDSDLYERTFTLSNVSSTAAAITEDLNITNSEIKEAAFSYVLGGDYAGATYCTSAVSSYTFFRIYATAAGVYCNFEGTAVTATTVNITLRYKKLSA